MKIVYSNHALKRLKQRGITPDHVEYVLQHPTYVKKSFEGRKEAVGTVENRFIKVVYIQAENYLKIITII